MPAFRALSGYAGLVLVISRGGVISAGGSVMSSTSSDGRGCSEKEILSLNTVRPDCPLALRYRRIPTLAGLLWEVNSTANEVDLPGASSSIPTPTPHQPPTCSRHRLPSQ